MGVLYYQIVLPMLYRELPVKAGEASAIGPFACFSITLFPVKNCWPLDRPPPIDKGLLELLKGLTGIEYRGLDNWA